MRKEIKCAKKNGDETRTHHVLWKAAKKGHKASRRSQSSSTALLCGSYHKKFSRAIILSLTSRTIKKSILIISQEGARLVVVGGFDHTEQKIPIPVLSTLSTDQHVDKIQDKEGS